MTTWKIRRDATPTLTTVLAAGEPGLDTTSKMLKIGDGSTPWSALPYYLTSSQRGIFAGGYNRNTIDYVEIPEKSNASDFGDLLHVPNWAYTAACSSSTRGCFNGYKNTIEYITISTLGNSSTFGYYPSSSSYCYGAGCGSSTRGIFSGDAVVTVQNYISYITISTLGNAQDFGDLTVAREYPAAFSSPTRGITAGGRDDVYVPSLNVIDYITIATTGNATDFGDLTTKRSACSGCSNPIIGITFSGYDYNTEYYSVNTIDYITIATTGNALDFGDASPSLQSYASCASPIYGLMAGGNTNSISYITFSLKSNTSDFGDRTVSTYGSGGCSNCHGGLS